MARIRTIKPSFFTSLTIAELTPEQRLTFIGLWTHCDDEGRCIYDPRLIKAALWPLDERTLEDIRSDIGALTEASLIAHYKVGNRAYLAINTWAEHQKISHPTKSTLPAPELDLIAPVTSTLEASGKSPENIQSSPENFLGERKGKEGKGSPLTEAPREDVQAICVALSRRIRDNGSKIPDKVPGTWLTQARLLIDTDQRPVKEILSVIEWCQSDGFWRSNILSMPTMREKYDKLRLQMLDSNKMQAKSYGYQTKTFGGNDGRPAVEE